MAFALRQHPIVSFQFSADLFRTSLNETKEIHMKERRNPKWWNQEQDSAWDRVKAAFKRDRDQTKHDFGGDEPDTDQDVDNTVKQAAGKEPIHPRRVATYEEMEPA